MIDTVQQPQVKSIENSTTYGKFEIEPLEPGFGTTLGNSLRRVLLSTLKGAAVTSVSIEGVAHEFSSIPFVKEDVTEIILNLKGLNLKSFVDDPVRLTLDVTGPKEVRASDIQAPSDVEIVNPDLYICTLDSNKGRLRMEDRKSTRLNSSHMSISYAVFCLKKKNLDTNVDWYLGLIYLGCTNRYTRFSQSQYCVHVSFRASFNYMPGMYHERAHYC